MISREIYRQALADAHQKLLLPKKNKAEAPISKLFSMHPHSTRGEIPIDACGGDLDTTVL
jgi:hypothetical protein